MRRWLAAAGLVAGVVLLTACGSRSPWWQQSGATSCGSPALARVAGHVQPAGACTGGFVIPASRVTVHVGEKIDIRMATEDSGTSGHHLVPLWPVPHSSPASMMRAVSAGKATATFTARRPGHAVLVTDSICDVPRTEREFHGKCPVLDVTILP